MSAMLKALGVRDLSGAVFFDFDDTLIHGDSLFLFLEELAGAGRVRLAFIGAAAAAAWRRWRGGERDFRGTVKASVLRRLLRGVPLTACAAAAERVAARTRWDPAMVAVLAGHRDGGDRVVLATGALDVYASAIIGPLGPLDGLICTPMEVVDGVLTGEMATPNCVRREKARRVAAWVAENGPFDHTIGYGNAPSDLPMMNRLDRGVVVRLAGGGRAPSLTEHVATEDAPTEHAAA